MRNAHHHHHAARPDLLDRLEPRRLLSTTYTTLPDGASFSEAQPELPAGAVFVDSLDLDQPVTVSGGAVWAAQLEGRPFDADDPLLGGVAPKGGAGGAVDAEPVRFGGDGVGTGGTAGETVNLGTRGREFDGVDRNDSGFIPPDTMGAVGLDHVVEMINGRFRVWDKNGNQLEDRSLNSFWINKAGASPTGSSFDPRVQYDQGAGRWYAVAVDNARSDNNFLFAVSGGEDPTAGWSGFKIDSDNGTGNRWADFPQMGFDNGGVYITANMFDIPGVGSNLNTAVNVLVLPKSGLMASFPTVGQRTKLEDVQGTTGFSLQPVVYKDSSEGVSAFPPAFASADTNSINFSGLAGTITSPTITDFSDVDVFPYDAPPLADQPGLPGNLQSGGSRIAGQVVEQNGLYFGVNGIDISDQAGVRFFKITTSNVLEQDRAIFLAGEEDLIYASIDANDAGDLVIGATATGSNRFPSSAYLASVDPGAGNDHQFPQFSITRAGNDTYRTLDGSNPPRNRWGDYSATHFDPADPSYFWTFQEYAKGVNNGTGNGGFTDVWGTNVTEVSPQGAVAGRLPRSLSFAEGYIVPFGPTGTSPDVQDFDAFINFDGDVDSFYLNSDNSLRGSGTATIDAGDAASPDVDPVLALYDADTGILEAINDDAVGVDDSRITFTLPSTSSRYIVAVTNKLYDPDPGQSLTGDVTIDVAWANSFDGSPIGLNAAGDGSQAVTIGPTEDSDFFRVLAPANAGGSVTFTLDPSSGLDGELWVFDAAGNVLGSGENFGTGVDETVTVNGVAAGQELFLTVQSNNFATSGTATLSVDFTTASAPPAPTPPDLAGGDDTGVSSSDNITRENDGLQFAVFAQPGQYVRLFRDGTLVAGPLLVNAATGGNSPTDNTGPLPDGTYVYTATASNTINGPQSPASAGVAVTIDTAAPAVDNFFFSFDAGPQDQRFFVDFDEENFGLTAGDFQVRNLTTGTNLPSGAFDLIDAGSGLNDLVYDPTAGNDVLPDGNYRVRLPAGVATDAAGNPNAAFEGFDFFLNGDFNRDRAVNLSDFTILANNFGDTNTTFTGGDATYDGNVNLSDFTVLANAFGTTLPAPALPASPGALFGDDGDDNGRHGGLFE